MKLRPQHSNRENGQRSARGSCFAFTLAEVLAALAFLAILIPIVVQCLTIASRAGEVAERKARAARVAENVLNESIVTTNWSQSSQSGSVDDGVDQYNWTLESGPWSQDPMRVLTANVKYTIQGKEYSVQLSTLVDESTLYSTNN